MSDDALRHLSETEIAIMDVFKTLLEVLFARGLAKPDDFDRLFASQVQQYSEKGMVPAAALVEMLRRFATAPERQEYRERLRIALTQGPKGTA